MTKKIGAIFLVLLFAASIGSLHHLADAKEMTVEDIVEKMKENQEKIKDLSADVETTITSTMGQAAPITQKGRMMTKSPDKSKIEVFSPMKQITITNGDMMTIISPDTGMKFTQDLKRSQEKGQMPHLSSPGDTSRALDYFNLTLSSSGTNEYVISGSPKEENDFLGRMDFFVDRERYLPMRIAIYSPDGILISLSEIDYVKIDGQWVPEKTSSSVSVPGGSMNIDMKFSDIKVNKGISDSEFKIE